VRDLLQDSDYRRNARIPGIARNIADGDRKKTPAEIEAAIRDALSALSSRTAA
jgi:hypothetical protein